jgi:hypothetical protein
MTPPERSATPRIVLQHLDDAAQLRSVRALLLRSPHVKLRDLELADERHSAVSTLCPPRAMRVHS